jgi:hypothetical protein
METFEMAFSGFTRLILDIREAERARERASEARNLWRDCVNNSLFIKTINEMGREATEMSQRLATTVREMQLRRKAEGRQRLAALIAEADAAIAAGLITGEQGARLDAAIAPTAEGLRE